MIKSAFVKAIAASSKLLPVSLKGYFRRTYSGQHLVDWLGLDTPIHSRMSQPCVTPSSDLLAGLVLCGRRWT